MGEDFLSWLNRAGGAQGNVFGEVTFDEGTVR